MEITTNEICNATGDVLNEITTISFPRHITITDAAHMCGHTPTCTAHIAISRYALQVTETTTCAAHPEYEGKFCRATMSLEEAHRRLTMPLARG